MPINIIILMRKNMTSDEVQHLYGDLLIIPTNAQNQFRRQVGHQ
jgi:hypothetical protein